MRTLFARGGGAARVHHRIRASSGMVTAEFAVGIMAVIPLVLSLVMLAGAAAVQVQVLEAARTGARMLARGDAQSAVRAHVSAALPDAEVLLTVDADQAQVTVSRPMRGLGVLPDFSISADARTPREVLE